MSTASPNRTNWLLFFALGAMWGSSYLFIKFGVETLTPLTLVASRLGFGVSLLALVLWFSKTPLPRNPRTYGHLLVMACINIVLPFFLITWAEQSVDSNLAAILNSTVPLFAIVIAAFFLHDEPITVNRLAGLGIGFVGVVLLVGRNLGSSQAEIGGELALLGSAVSYAAGAVYSRRNVRGLRPMIPAFFQVAFAFVISGTLALVFEHPFSLPWNGTALVSVIWLGFIGSGVAYLANFRLLRDWGATRTTMIAYLLPIVGIVLGVVVRNERIDLFIFVGTGLVIGGIALVNSRYGARRLFGRAAPAATAEAATPAADRR